VKIALVTELFPPSFGGQEIRFREFAEEFARNGHSVDVFTIDHTGKLPKEETINRVRIFRTWSDADYYKQGFLGRPVRSIFGFTWSLRGRLKEYDGVIYNQFPVLPSMLSRLMVRRGAVRVLDFVEYRLSRLWRVINFLLLRTVNHVVCISDSVRDLVEKNLGSADRLSVIPSSVFTARFSSHTKDHAVFLGRLETHKHPEHAIAAVLEFNRLFGKALQIHLVGGGGMLDELKARHLNDRNVIFHGFVSDEQKLAVLSSARIFILPSEREGLPKSIVECMACGVPTITTDYPQNGGKDFVRSTGVGVVAKPDPAALAQAIAEIEKDYARFEKRCRELVPDYDVPANARRYLAIVGGRRERVGTSGVPPAPRSDTFSDRGANRTTARHHATDPAGRQ
jgi:glycosyltransferase involved in cell wall biosynthesis